jgi:hypothetical protein
VVDGEIGTPHQIHIISRDPAPPSLEYIRQSGGIFTDMTIHDFDMARFLVGDEVVRLYATGAALVDPRIGEAGDIDTATILLEFAQGAVGVIENSRRAVYGYDQRVEVFGSGGSARTDNNYPNSAYPTLRFDGFGGGNGYSGAITTDATSLAVGAEATFTVTNNKVKVDSVVVVSLRTPSATGLSQAFVSKTQAGSFDITVSNLHGATADTSASVINYFVINGNP